MYLKYNFENWDIIRQKWRSTWPIRRIDYVNATVDDITKNWPLFADPRATELVLMQQKIKYFYTYSFIFQIDIDFDLLIQSQATIFDRWDNFTSKVIAIFERELRSQACRKTLKELQKLSDCQGMD